MLVVTKKILLMCHCSYDAIVAGPVAIVSDNNRGSIVSVAVLLIACQTWLHRRCNCRCIVSHDGVDDVTVIMVSMM